MSSLGGPTLKKKKLSNVHGSNFLCANGVTVSVYRSPKVGCLVPLASALTLHLPVLTLIIFFPKNWVDQGDLL